MRGITILPRRGRGTSDWISFLEFFSGGDPLTQYLAKIVSDVLASLLVFRRGSSAPACVRQEFYTTYYTLVPGH